MGWRLQSNIKVITMLKFTNAVGGREGDPLYINKEWIVSVYEFSKVPGGSLVTGIYGGPQGSLWEVSESISEVIKIINS